MKLETIIKTNTLLLTLYIKNESIYVTYKIDWTELVR